MKLILVEKKLPLLFACVLSICLPGFAIGMVQDGEEVSTSSALTEEVPVASKETPATSSKKTDLPSIGKEATVGLQSSGRVDSTDILLDMLKKTNAELREVRAKLSLAEQEAQRKAIELDVIRNSASLINQKAAALAAQLSEQRGKADHTAEVESEGVKLREQQQQFEQEKNNWAEKEQSWKTQKSELDQLKSQRDSFQTEKAALVKALAEAKHGHSAAERSLKSDAAKLRKQLEALRLNVKSLTNELHEKEREKAVAVQQVELKAQEGKTALEAQLREKSEHIVLQKQQLRNLEKIKSEWGLKIDDLVASREKLKKQLIEVEQAEERARLAAAEAVRKAEAEKQEAIKQLQEAQTRVLTERDQSIAKVQLDLAAATQARDEMTVLRDQVQRELAEAKKASEIDRLAAAEAVRKAEAEKQEAIKQLQEAQTRVLTERDQSIAKVQQDLAAATKARDEMTVLRDQVQRELAEAKKASERDRLAAVDVARVADERHKAVQEDLTSQLAHTRQALEQEKTKAVEVEKQHAHQFAEQQSKLEAVKQHELEGQRQKFDALATGAAQAAEQKRIAEVRQLTEQKDSLARELESQINRARDIETRLATSESDRKKEAEAAVQERRQLQQQHEAKIAALGAQHTQALGHVQGLLGTTQESLYAKEQALASVQKSLEAMTAERGAVGQRLTSAEANLHVAAQKETVLKEQLMKQLAHEEGLNAKLATIEQNLITAQNEKKSLTEQLVAAREDKVQALATAAQEHRAALGVKEAEITRLRAEHEAALREKDTQRQQEVATQRSEFETRLATLKEQLKQKLGELTQKAEEARKAQVERAAQAEVLRKVTEESTAQAEALRRAEELRADQERVALQAQREKAQRELDLAAQRRELDELQRQEAEFAVAKARFAQKAFASGGIALYFHKCLEWVDETPAPLSALFCVLMGIKTSGDRSSFMSTFDSKRTILHLDRAAYTGAFDAMKSLVDLPKTEKSAIEEVIAGWERAATEERRAAARRKK